ncbi:hypothetical protein C8Q79DRAFT_169902 [Trametes meyenii]|nr:hypothetical protein C8Q79DRAFT_169902 [Trametes meyenii]
MASEAPQQNTATRILCDAIELERAKAAKSYWDRLIGVSPEGGTPLQKFRVPIPDNTDPDFAIEVFSQGSLGMRVDLASGQMHSAAHCVISAIESQVNGATRILDGHFPARDRYLCTASLAFVDDTSIAKPIRALRSPQKGFTLAHLLSMLVRQQYRRWNKLKLARRHMIFLKDIVGPREAGEAGDRLVFVEHLYIVGVRRREAPFRRRGPSWCYYPEVEIRI